MTRIAPVTVVAALLAACSPTPEAVRAPEPAPDTGPFSVILFIGDGTGLAHWSAARLANGELAVDQLSVVGLVDTEAANDRITDSAASATAYASGQRTYNGAIGVGPDSAAVETVLEWAEERGMATGLVATSSITHATPAAFATHVVSRDMHYEIAAQLADSDVDVLLGGGRAYFDPAERPDGRDLLGEMAGDGLVLDAAGIATADLTGVDRLVGFTAENHPPPAAARKPTLANLTQRALELLERDDDGFFLMVEGSQIDWFGHSNRPLSELIPEVADLDHAVRAGLAFQERRPNTLIVVTADHETGGLALHYDENGTFGAHYTTEGHTAELVPLFAGGPGAAALGGIHANDGIGRALLALVRGDAPVPGP